MHRRLVSLATAALLATATTATADDGPAVRSVAPAEGPEAGGTDVTITGAGFVAGATVTICGATATEVVVIAVDRITAVTPPGGGICDVVVTSPDGREGRLTGGFRYVAGAGAAPEGEIAAPEYEGQDAVVTGTRVPRRLADTPVLTELIPAERVESKGASCLLDALAYEPGVRVDNQCSICNTSGVKLSGMPGRYTALLIDGVPVYSSLGQTYGWLMLSAADVERIEIVKGANSILYGTDAMGGVVNVITRDPQEGAHGMAAVELGTYGYHDVLGNGAVARGPLSLSVVGSHTSHDSVDRDGDEVSEFAGYDRGSFACTMRLDTAPVDAMVRASATQERRQGGGLGSFIDVLSDERRGFTESILSRRLEGASVIDVHASPAVDLETTLGLTHHLQDSDYEGEVYGGTQWLIFAQEAVVARLHPRYSLVGGAGYRGEFLAENLALNPYRYHTPAVFVQGDWMPAPAFELLHGLRFDHHNVFGPVLTPRIGLRLTPTPPLTLRVTGGTGFRTPTTFYEYAHGVRPEGYEIHMDADEPERSINVGGSASLDLGRAFRATLSSGWNRVLHAITVDVTEEGNLEVYNVDAPLDVVPIELEIQSSPASWLRLSGGYGHYEYRDAAGALVSAPPRDVWDLDIDVDVRRIGLRANVYLELVGPMDLVGVYGEAYNGQGTAGSGDMTLERWLDPSYADLDSPKLERSPWWGTVDLRVEQRLFDGLSAYVGIKNLTDVHQCSVETPLMYPAEEDGSAGDADVVYIWGPLRGRHVYGGLRMRL